MKRASWFTWVVFACVCLAMVLIIVPGVRVNQFTKHRSHWKGPAKVFWNWQIEEAVERCFSSGLASGEHIVVSQYEHGWPLPFMTRGVGRVIVLGKGTFVRGHPATEAWLSVNVPSDGDAFQSVPLPNSQGYKFVPTEWATAKIHWSDYSHWPFAIDAAEWRWEYLLVDLLVMTAIVLVSVVAAESWVRSRGGVLRFRLIDLAAACACLAVALAWVHSHNDLRRVERVLEKRGAIFLFPEDTMRRSWENRHQGKSGYTRWRGESSCPEWLPRLLGNQQFVRFSKHLVMLDLAPDDTWEENLELLPRLVHLDTVTLHGGASARAIEQLAKLPGLRRLEVAVGAPPFQQPPSGNPPGSEEPWLRAQDLAACLRPLAIEELGIVGDNLIFEDVEAILATLNLKSLEMVGASLTRRQLTRLREEHPRVEIHFERALEFFSTASRSTNFQFVEEPHSDVERAIRSIKQQREGVRAQAEGN